MPSRHQESHAQPREKPAHVDDDATHGQHLLPLAISLRVQTGHERVVLWLTLVDLQREHVARPCKLEKDRALMRCGSLSMKAPTKITRVR